MLTIEAIRDFNARMSTATANSSFKKPSETKVWTSTWNHKAAVLKDGILALQTALTAYFQLPLETRKQNMEVTKTEVNKKFSNIVTHWESMAGLEGIEDSGNFTAIFTVVREYRKAGDDAAQNEQTKATELAAELYKVQAKLLAAERALGEHSARERIISGLSDKLDTAKEAIGGYKLLLNQLNNYLSQQGDPAKILDSARSLMRSAEPPVLVEERQPRLSQSTSQGSSSSSLSSPQGGGRASVSSASGAAPTQNNSETDEKQNMQQYESRHKANNGSKSSH